MSEYQIMQATTTSKAEWTTYLEGRNKFLNGVIDSMLKQPHSTFPWHVDKYIGSQIQQPLVSKRRRIICPPDADGFHDAAFIARVSQILNAYELNAWPSR